MSNPKQVVMTSQYLIAQEPFHKNIIPEDETKPSGAVSVVLWVSPDLPTEVEALKLLKDQAALLREMANVLESNSVISEETPKGTLH